MTKTNFNRILHLNWLANIELKGPGLLVVNIIANYCCTHVLSYAKLLKEIETEETRLFCHIFFIVGISIGRGAGPLPGYAYHTNTIIC